MPFRVDKLVVFYVDGDGEEHADDGGSEGPLEEVAPRVSHLDDVLDAISLD